MANKELIPHFLQPIAMASAASSIATAETQYAALPLPLGVSLPPGDAHALSVSMPGWEDVVGYEEGRPEVLNAMACGYPRFFRHPLVVQLMDHLKSSFAPFQQLQGDHEWNLMALPTEATAQRLHHFLSTQDDATASDQQSVAIHSVQDGLAWVVVFADALTPTANRFWQHTGEILSSRHAQRIHQLLTATTKATDGDVAQQSIQLRGTVAHTTVCERVAQLYSDASSSSPAVQANDVFLYPTGMGSIFAAVRLLTHFTKDAKAILFGFPYLDSLKILQRSQWCPAGVHFFPVSGDHELAQVEELLKKEKILAIFTEFPSNPLLALPDLEKLAALAHAHGTCLVVDDTIGSYNVNPMKYGVADLVVTSLSKIFHGTCNVMAGSLVVNPQSKSHDQFVAHLTATNDSFLVDQDAQLLCEYSLDVDARRVRVNGSTSSIVERLQHHPLVKALYYPQLSSDVERYRRFLIKQDEEKHQFGPLFSIVLHGGEPVARAFYDHLQVAKGPSLGTNFTIACPYTLLAHFYELEFVESCGVDRHLVRISIGLEDPEILWAALQDALAKAESVFQQE